jgi:alpha-amylase
MVDDTHFFYAGLEEKNTRGYFLTEDEGNVLKIFPMSKQMRYAIPFHTIEKLKAELKEINVHPSTSLRMTKISQSEIHNSQILLYGDDGEKFGVWPKTHELVFGKKWLEIFFGMLEENSDWIETKNFSETIKEISPLGTMYLPTASYSEMLHWALPTKAFIEYEDFEKQLQEKKLFDDYQQFVRGGYWKDFALKYSEINWLHKRMFDVSKQIASQTNRNVATQKAEEHLHSAQCNDVYWHGIFGGLYLPWLRRPIFQNLIEAEKNISTNQNKISVFDIDVDGEKEIFVSTSTLNLFLKPSLGGEIAEIDFKPIAHNLSDVITRRREGYHRKVLEAKKESENEVATIHELVKTKEKGIEKFIVEDKFRRLSLLDHFFEHKVSLDDIVQQNWKTVSSFAEEKYSSSLNESEKNILIALQRNGTIISRKKGIPVSLEKKISILKSSAELEIVYLIESEDKLPNVLFGSEWNLTLSAGDADDRYFLFDGKKPKEFHLRSEGEAENVSSLKMIDEWLNIEVEFHFEKSVNLRRYPVETVSLSEDGFERVYQGSCLLPLWKLGGKKSFETSFKFSVKQFK